jgi:hypothetical protein
MSSGIAKDNSLMQRLSEAHDKAFKTAAAGLTAEDFKRVFITQDGTNLAERVGFDVVAEGKQLVDGIVERAAVRTLRCFLHDCLL